MFQDDIELLVAQTFKDAENLSREDGGFRFLDEEFGPNKGEPEECPGVLYYLQKNSSTFVLRMLPSSNLREDYKKVLASPEDYPSLRLLSADDDRELHDKLSFHECDNIALAKALKEQLANKRYPLHEERIINVSDPGDNWWIKKDGNNLSLFFKLCRTESIDCLVKAGPLGDREGSLKFLNQLYGYFSLLFPVKDFSSAHGQFVLSCEESENPFFEELADVFVKGEIGNRMWEKLRELEGQAPSEEVLSSLKRANYFLMEVAAIRSFWIEVEKSLD